MRTRRFYLHDKEAQHLLLTGIPAVIVVGKVSGLPPGQHVVRTRALLLCSLRFQLRNPGTLTSYFYTEA